MAEEANLDRLAEMLRIIKQNEPKPSEPPRESPRREFLNSGMTREEVAAKADEVEAEAKRDPSYEFTLKVFDRALADMLPLALKSNDGSPLTDVLDEVGLNPFLMNKHLAELLVSAIRAMPQKAQDAIMEDIEIGQVLISMLTFAVTEMIFIVAAAKRLKGVDSPPQEN